MANVTRFRSNNQLYRANIAPAPTFLPSKLVCTARKFIQIPTLAILRIIFKSKKYNWIDIAHLERLKYFFQNISVGKFSVLRNIEASHTIAIILLEQ